MQTKEDILKTFRMFLSEQCVYGCFTFNMMKRNISLNKSLDYVLSSKSLDIKDLVRSSFTWPDKEVELWVEISDKWANVCKKEGLAKKQ